MPFSVNGCSAYMEEESLHENDLGNCMRPSYTLGLELRWVERDTDVDHSVLTNKLILISFYI